MRLSIRLIVVAVLSVFSVNLQSNAQRLRFNLAFDGLFDNREFKGDVMPQTIYGMRLTPQIGFENGNHLITYGVSAITRCATPSTSST